MDTDEHRLVAKPFHHRTVEPMLPDKCLLSVSICDHPWLRFFWLEPELLCLSRRNIRQNNYGNR